MGSKIETIKVSLPLFSFNKGYIPCAIRAAKKCLKKRGAAEQIGMLISTGVYREKHIVEPALSALILRKLIQKSFLCRSFSQDRFKKILAFDLNNGACGLIQALQIIDGYIQSGKIESGLVIAGDSLPKTGKTENYPFSQGAAAILLSKGGMEKGFVCFKTESYPQYKDDFIGYSHFTKGKRVLTIDVKKDFLDHTVRCALTSLDKFLDEEKMKIEDVDLVICSQYPDGFASEIRNRPDLKDKIIYPNGIKSGFHTSAPLFALHSIFKTQRFRTAKNILFLTVGAGITTSIALYSQ